MAVNNSLDRCSDLIDIVFWLLSPKTVTLDSTFQSSKAHFNAMVVGADLEL